MLSITWLIPRHPIFLLRRSRSPIICGMERRWADLLPLCGVGKWASIHLDADTKMAAYSISQHLEGETLGWGPSEVSLTRW